MRLKITTIAVVLLLLLAGCGNSNNAITVDDLSIHKVGDSKSKVTYGMSRDDAEKVLGRGKGEGFGSWFTYNSGVQIMYREDKVAGIALREESAGTYETSKGAKVGMLKDELKKIYGDNYLGDHERNLDYAYDTVNKKFLKESESPKTQEENEKTYVISAVFDDNGYAQTIMLLDRRMAMYFN